jgi:hypothetical protein
MSTEGVSGAVGKTGGNGSEDVAAAPLLLLD